MKIPNSAAFDTAIFQYNKFSDSPKPTERIAAPKTSTLTPPGAPKPPETYSFPEITTPARPVVDTQPERASRNNMNFQTNADGDTLDLDFSRIKRFVDRFGWDKVPPDNLRGVEHFREKRLTIINQDGDRLDINLRTARGQRSSIYGGTLVEGADALEQPTGCSACEGRRYVDRSSDSSVSYQTPTNLNPRTAAADIAAHEREHVNNERARADRNDRKIIDQTVTIHYSTCPECNTIYPSGGTTRTTTISNSGEEQGSSPAEQDE